MSDVTVLHIDTPTARTEHVCSNCGRTIRKGETYERQDNIFDGNRYAFKVCAHCRVATSRALTLASWWPDEGIDWWWIEGVLCDQRQTIADLRMLVHFRRRWTRADGSLYPVPEPTDPEGNTP